MCILRLSDKKEYIAYEISGIKDNYLLYAKISYIDLRRIFHCICIDWNMENRTGKGRTAYAEMIRLQKNLAEEVFRFHVLANSDTKEDQALKMQVKEAVISYMKEMLPAGADRKETKQWVIWHQEEIEKVAESVILEQGYSYSVHAKVTKSTFPDKTYGDVMLPAGEYEALRIEIGEAKGQNWWCMLYPSLCFTDAVHAVVEEDGKEKLKDTLTEEEYELVTETKKFKLKWFFFGEGK